MIEWFANYWQWFIGILVGSGVGLGLFWDIYKRYHDKKGRIDVVLGEGILTPNGASVFTIIITNKSTHPRYVESDPLLYFSDTGVKQGIRIFDPQNPIQYPLKVESGEQVKYFYSKNNIWQRLGQGLILRVKVEDTIGEKYISNWLVI